MVIQGGCQVRVARLCPWRRSLQCWRGWCHSLKEGGTLSKPVSIKEKGSGALPLASFFFFKNFLMWVIFIKSLFNLLHYCFYFMFWFSGPKACGIIAPQPEMEPPPPALEGEALTTELPGKPYPSPLLHSLIYLFQKRKQASSSKALAAHCTWLEFNNRTL